MYYQFSTLIIYGEYLYKKFYKKMPISEKCCICKSKDLLVETKHFVYLYTGCKVCRLKKKYFNTDNNEVTITKYYLNKGRYK